ELRDDDHADDARAVEERHCEQRLLDRRRSLDPRAELAVRRVADQERLAALGEASRDALADPDAEQLERQRNRLDDELAAERDRLELLAVDDEHATVVVVDERAQLGRN